MTIAMYLWIKAFHIIAVIAWMAGMLYLPRLFVYHCGAAPGSQQSETFKLMERRLLKLIINPAMIATWVLGLALIWLMGKDAFLAAGWLHVKLVLVIAMSGLHGFFAGGEDRQVHVTVGRWCGEQTERHLLLHVLGPELDRDTARVPGPLRELPWR